VRGYLEAFVIAFLVVTFGFTTVGVAGSSMEPTLNGGSGRLPESLLTGDRLFIPKYETWLRRAGLMPGYRRGSVVVVREPADSPVRQGRRNFVVKRVIGVPGDTVEMRSGEVFINGVRLDQSFITEHGVPLGNSTLGPLTLSENEYFLLGDNRTNSADSRLYGPVPFMSIAGRAAAVIFPPWREDGWNWRVLRPPEAFAELAARLSSGGAARTAYLQKSLHVDQEVRQDARPEAPREEHRVAEGEPRQKGVERVAPPPQRHGVQQAEDERLSPHA